MQVYGSVGAEYYLIKDFTDCVFCCIFGYEAKTNKQDRK